MNEPRRRQGRLGYVLLPIFLFAGSIALVGPAWSPAPVVGASAPPISSSQSVRSPLVGPAVPPPEGVDRRFVVHQSAEIDPNFVVYRSAAIDPSFVVHRPAEIDPLIVITPSGTIAPGVGQGTEARTLSSGPLRRPR